MQNGRDDRNSISPCSDHGLQGIDRDAADGKDWQLSQRSNLAESLDADRWFVMGFRAGQEDRAESQVVGSPPRGLFNLRRSVGRDPDDFRWTQEGPSMGER